MSDTEQLRVVDPSSPHCGKHSEMLTKGEFRWVLGVLISILGAVVIGVLSGSASQTSVEIIKSQIAECKAQIASGSMDRQKIREEVRDELRLLRSDLKAEFRDMRTEIQKRSP